MKLIAVRVFAGDWERLCDFYEQMVVLPLKFKDAAAGWAEFDVGGPSLAIERVTENDSEGQALIGRFLGISLRVMNISAAYRQLQVRGVEFLEPPEKQAWGGTLAHFRDPEGNVLTLVG